jgi:hypothetical protein
MDGESGSRAGANCRHCRSPLHPGARVCAQCGRGQGRPFLVAALVASVSVGLLMVLGTMFAEIPPPIDPVLDDSEHSVLVELLEFKRRHRLPDPDMADYADLKIAPRRFHEFVVTCGIRRGRDRSSGEDHPRVMIFNGAHVSVDGPLAGPGFEYIWRQVGCR